MKKTAKKAVRPPARKVNAVHREREGKQKKKRLPPHIEEDTRPVVDVSPPDVIEMAYDQQAGWGAKQAMGDACAKQAEPSPVERLEKTVYGMREELHHLTRSVVPQAYRDAYGPEGHCGDMVAVILAYRSQDEIEMFVYERTMKAWPGVNAGMRRMNAGNVIRGLLRQGDVETMGWLLQTQPR